MTTSVEDKAVEARHLRRLLDTQPGCLMRVASTGEILAANDAAVELLGAAERKFALGVSLTNWIVPDQIASWNDFVDRVVAGGRTSLETHLVTGDLRRRALLHGTPLLDHPDGVSSLLVAVHDISERIVLETAIERMRQSAETAAATSGEFDGEIEVPLDEPPVDGKSLQERFDRLAADHESAMAAAAEAAEVQRQLQRELEQKIEQLTAAHLSAEAALAEAVEARQWIQRDFDERLAAAQQTKQVSDQTAGSVRRLQRQLEEQQARLEELDADRIATVKQLAGAMAGRFQAEARLQEFVREHEAQIKAPADWDLRMREATDRQQQLAADLEAAERRLETVAQESQAHAARAAAERAAALAQMDEATTERRRLKAELSDAATRQAQLAAEMQALQASLEARQTELKQLTAEYTAALARLDEASIEARRLGVQLSDAEARRDQPAIELQLRGRPDEAAKQLQAALEARQTELAQAVAERSAALAQVEEATAERRRLEAHLSDAEVRREQLAVELHKALTSVEAKKELQAALDARQAELTQAVAGRSSALAQLDKERVDRRALEARLGEAEAQVNEALAERRRLEGQLSEADARHGQLAAELNSAQASLQAALETKRELQAGLDARQAELAQTRVERAAALKQVKQATTERQRLEKQLGDAETRFTQQADELQRARRELQVALDATHEFERSLEERQVDLTRAVAERSAALAQLDEAAETRRQLEARISDVQVRMDESTAERRRLEAQVEDAKARQAQLTGELHDAQASLLEVRRSFQKALEAREVELTQVGAARAAVSAQLEEVLAERRQLEKQLRDAEVREQQLTAELTAAQAVAEEKRRLQIALEKSEAQLTQLSSERAAVQARVDGLMAERNRLEGQLADADARREQLLAEVKDAQMAAESGLRIAAEFEAERTRLEQSVELLAGQHRAELAREAADQQRLHVLLDLAGQQHQDLRARLQDAELQCRERQVQLDQTVAAHRALQARTQALDAAQQEALTSHSAARARLEELLAAAEAARDKHAEAVVNREVVLSALAEHSRRLTPLVTTGRVARELAPQLRELVERVDGLANQVLEDCHLDRPGRADLELLRAEAVRAGALASELLSAGAESDVARVIIDRRNRTEGRS